MDLVVASWETDGSGVPTALVALVDEMQEDPRCRAAMLGTDDTGALLVTVWDGGFGEEVANALASDYPQLRVRRLDLGPDAFMVG